MKKWLLVVAAAVGASIVKKNVDRSKSEKDLWSEATAPSRSSTTPAAPEPKDPWASATETPS
ncbi:MAG: DLW-39 family protein [Nostocoides sp.]|uniref:DLW-39 family protein n=1 Tax=Nostocoides sp. TaxID=1917966 RepID=UPI003BD5580E